MIEYFAIIFLLPAALVLAVTPGVIRFAKVVGAIDTPNQRKIHQHPIPRLGGMSICIGFMVSLFLFLTSGMIPHFAAAVFSFQWSSFIIAAAIIFSIGVKDDITPLNPGIKFAVQSIAAAVVYLGGFRISVLTSLLSPGTIDIGIIDLPLTILWIVGTTNAFNLIDGLDGLATGTGIIAAASMFMISVSQGHMTTAVLVLALSGCLFGFLFYNFHPARIFLGDSGSLLIGFSLAVLSIHTETKGSTAFAIVVPFLALGLPIMDTLLAMIRRLLFSLLPEQRGSFGKLFLRLHSMFLPDRKHIHHQLMSLGLSHRNVVLVLYVVSLLFGASAFAVTIVNVKWASFVFGAAGVAVFIGIRQLRYQEMAILSNGILLPIYEWPLVRRKIFQGFVDLGFCLCACTAAFQLTQTDPAPVDSDEAVMMMMLTAGVQIAVFHVTGMYQRSFRHSGIGDVFHIAKVSSAAVGGAAVALLFSEKEWIQITPSLILTDFYLLVSLIAGSRMSLQMLNVLFERKQTAGHNVLIYGAGANGILLLDHLLHNKPLQYHPVGFLDDDPMLEGKTINGYTVFGGHWTLKRMIKEHSVDEILIASDSMRPEILRRVMSASEELNIPVRRRTITFLDMAPVTKNRAQKHRVFDGIESPVTQSS